VFEYQSGVGVGVERVQSVSSFPEDCFPCVIIPFYPQRMLPQYKVLCDDMLGVADENYVKVFWS
jgi:hypothetical protein